MNLAGDEKPAVAERADAEGDEEGDGAILDFTPHGSYICGLKYAPRLSCPQTLHMSVISFASSSV